ncbi:MAG: 30S ribosomal protein S15 [bacterium]|nr:30S ribosomal protein S15 [bacterium]
MARMYSRKKGKAGSKRPIKKAKASWVSYKAKEVELLVMKIAKDGKTPSQIGMILRDSYGIPDIVSITKKSISKILKEKEMLPNVPEDLMAVIKRAILIKKHLEANHKDVPAKRGLEITESKIRKLTKYYKRTGKLDESWKYDPDKIRLLID